ncbi:hypothetical protein [Listeria ilorinensis]|nr:hypothetical protein [Listeria ilorinensis]
MFRVLLVLTAIVFPAFLIAITIYQVYKKKTTTYMPLKNEFSYWMKS